ncbi:MAG: DUF885 family protein, partial [Vicinamibacterales bacterium]
MPSLLRTPLTLIAIGMVAAACTSKAPERPAASQDAPFTAVAGEYLDDIFRRQPTQATDLGIHKYDDRLEDYSRQGVMDAIAAARRFRDRANAIDPSALSADTELDREQLLHAIDSRILMLAVVRPWAKDADSYSSGVTNTAYVMIKRRFAPPEERLRKLIAREKGMPAALLEARKNIENPPLIYTQIAIEQLDGNRSFFEAAVPGAFKEVQDKALLDEFRKTNDAVIAALQAYKKWLQDDLLKRSNGEFAFGADTYRKKLSADEMIDVPLDELLAIADRDLR